MLNYNCDNLYVVVYEYLDVLFICQEMVFLYRYTIVIYFRLSLNKNAFPFMLLLNEVLFISLVFQISRT